MYNVEKVMEKEYKEFIEYIQQAARELNQNYSQENKTTDSTTGEVTRLTSEKYGAEGI